MSVKALFFYVLLSFSIHYYTVCIYNLLTLSDVLNSESVRIMYADVSCRYNVTKFWQRWTMIGVSVGNVYRHLRVITTKANISRFCADIMSSINVSCATLYLLGKGERRIEVLDTRDSNLKGRNAITCLDNFLSS